MTISCQDADVLAAALSVGSIDQVDGSALQGHLTSCGDCRRAAGEYMAAAARLPIALEPLQPSPELRTRLMKAVYAEAALDAERSRTAEPVRSTRRRPTWIARAWARIPTGRGFTALAGAAALAVVAVGSWTYVTRQNPAPTAVAVPLTVMLTGAHAHGQLLYYRGGNQAVLTVSGLPGPVEVAGGSAVYEVWLVRADGSTVAAAFLTQDPDGTWSAALHRDAGMSGFATVAATIEPPGGSKVPTGAEVLHAPLNSA